MAPVREILRDSWMDPKRASPVERWWSMAPVHEILRDSWMDPKRASSVDRWWTMGTVQCTELSSYGSQVTGARTETKPLQTKCSHMIIPVLFTGRPGEAGYSYLDQTHIHGYTPMHTSTHTLPHINHLPLFEAKILSKNRFSLKVYNIT